MYVCIHVCIYVGMYTYMYMYMYMCIDVYVCYIYRMLDMFDGCCIECLVNRIVDTLRGLVHRMLEIVIASEIDCWIYRMFNSECSMYRISGKKVLKIWTVYRVGTAHSRHRSNGPTNELSIWVCNIRTKQPSASSLGRM